MKHTAIAPLCLVFLLSCVSVHMANAQVNVAVRNTEANITLIWEALSYVPPFYKGRALMPDGGDSRILALLPPELSSAKALNYTWRVDGVVDGSGSGIGRNIYELQSGIFGGSPLIVVEASDETGVVGTGVLRIPLTKPRALLYADAPLGGILFNTESPHLEGKELAMETYPLFFTTPVHSDPDISYAWKVNGSSVVNPLGNNSRLALRAESTAGTTTIDVYLTNDRRILERASGKASIFLE